MINPVSAVRNFAVKTAKTVKADSPTVLTAMGIVAFGATVVLVAKETPKAVVDLERAEKDKNDKLNPVEKASVLAKNYWPAAVTGVSSVTCFLAANHISFLRIQAAMAAYKMSENKFAEYQDKVVEKFGAKKEHEVRNDISSDQMESHNAQLDNPDLIPHTKGGNTLCYDKFSGRYFYSDMQTLRAAVNDLNVEFNADTRFSSGSGVVTLNQFYEKIGLDEINVGDKFLWSSDSTGLLDPDFDSLLTKTGVPVLVVDWENGPVFNESEYRDLII